MQRGIERADQRMNVFISRTKRKKRKEIYTDFTL